MNYLAKKSANFQLSRIICWRDYLQSFFFWHFRWGQTWAEYNATNSWFLIQNQHLEVFRYGQDRRDNFGGHHPCVWKKTPIPNCRQYCKWLYYWNVYGNIYMEDIIKVQYVICKSLFCTCPESSYSNGFLYELGKAEQPHFLNQTVWVRNESISYYHTFLDLPTKVYELISP